MTFSNRAFRFFTRISLTKDIGVVYATKTPSHTRHYYARVVRRQADSIRFIAAHCPSLRYLQYEPHLVAIKTCKRYHLDLVSKAYKLLVENCPLQNLQIFCWQHYRRCGCSTRDPHVVSPARIRIHEELQVGATRDPEEMERVGTWAKNTLLRMRLHRELLIECPRGRRPGAYHGRWEGPFSHGLSFDEGSLLHKRTYHMP